MTTINCQKCFSYCNRNFGWLECNNRAVTANNFVIRQLGCLSTTNSTGNYNFATLSAGTYELRTTKAGRAPATQMITVNKGASTTANVSLP